jgi:hypothetical protein
MRPNTILTAMVVVGGLFAASTAVNADDVKRDIAGEAKLHRDHSFTAINVPLPGVGETAAIGINDRRQIVGFYNDGTGHHGFVDDSECELPHTPPLSTTT